MVRGTAERPSKNSPALSVVVPAFNEELGIEIAVTEIVRELAELRSTGRVSDVEILVIDDGSTDDTAAVLSRVSQQHPELRVVQHGRNQGLGAALRSGLREASGDFVFYTDADLPVDLSVISTALDLMTDGVVAACAYRTGRRSEGARRYVYSAGYNWMCRHLLGIDVRDVNFAAKLVRAEAARNAGLRSEGSFIDAELLARLSRAGGKIRQFPATYRPRAHGRSTLASPRVMATIVRELVQITRAGLSPTTAT